MGLDEKTKTLTDHDEHLVQNKFLEFKIKKMKDKVVKMHLAGNFLYVITTKQLLKFHLNKKVLLER